MYTDIHTDTQTDETTVMSHELLSQIEAGCYGKMKIENGKIVFECISVHPPPYPPPSVPAPSAPPLVEDNTFIIDELRDELRETKDRLAVLEQQVAQLFQFREAVHMPGATYRYKGRTDLYNFNTTYHPYKIFIKKYFCFCFYFFIFCFYFFVFCFYFFVFLFFCFFTTQ